MEERYLLTKPPGDTWDFSGHPRNVYGIFNGWMKDFRDVEVVHICRKCVKETKITSPLKNRGSETSFLLGRSIVRGYVSLQSWNIVTKSLSPSWRWCPSKPHSWSISRKYPPKRSKDQHFPMSQHLHLPKSLQKHRLCFQCVEHLSSDVEQKSYRPHELDDPMWQHFLKWRGVTWNVFGCQPKNKEFWGPQIIHFNRVWNHYFLPSILFFFPYFWKHPFEENKTTLHPMRIPK